MGAERERESKILFKVCMTSSYAPDSFCLNKNGFYGTFKKIQKEKQKQEKSLSSKDQIAFSLMLDL